MMDRVQILVGNEPRLYREVLAEAIRFLRPDLAVAVTDPNNIDCVVANHDSQIVVCSHLTDIVLAEALAWIQLYPENRNLAIVGRGGQQTCLAAVELADILAVVDLLVTQLGNEPTSTPGRNEMRAG